MMKHPMRGLRFAERLKAERYARKFRLHYEAIRKAKSKRIVHFVDGHVYRGVGSKHRLPMAQRMNTALRIQRNRIYAAQ
jgi:hypothetical protein